MRLLEQNQETLNSRLGHSFHLAQVGARRPNPKSGLDDAIRVNDIFVAAGHPEASVLIELIGGTDHAYELTKQALTSGKSVVTANKALVAEKGEELIRLAHANGVHYLYEAAVAGGIPIIKVLREGLVANRIHRITGIVNGTCNYILSQMSAGTFADTLKEAQELGYAERDPTFDIDGTDSLHKITILAGLAFDIPLSPDKVYRVGIEHLTKEDVCYAEQLNYVIKHLAVAEILDDESVSMRVQPALVETDSPLARVTGVTNALMIESDPLGQTFFSGPGAGGPATASAVLSDLAHVATTAAPTVMRTKRQMRFAPVESLESEFYLRISAAEKPGVMAHITGILSEAGISIEALHQREHAREDKSPVPIIILTHTTSYKNMRDALTKIENSDASLAPVISLPIFPS